MPIYSFRCDKCDLTFDYLCRYDERDSVVCEMCQSSVNRLVTTPAAVTFSNPKGTSKEDNFEYVAKYNYERAQSERRAAEKANKHGNVYKPIDDSRYEGKIV